MFRRIFKTQQGRNDAPAEAEPPRRVDEAVLAVFPIFPVQNETVAKAFKAYRVHTAHGTRLAIASDLPVIVHEHNPPPDREVILFRSNYAPHVGVLVAPRDLDLYDGKLIAPLLPIILIEHAQAGRLALRSPIRIAHVCALQPEGSPLVGKTDFDRSWIGPWELFSTEKVLAPIVRKQAELALADVGRLLERNLHPSDITVWMRSASGACRDTVMQVLVHLLSHAQVAASETRWSEEAVQSVVSRSSPSAAICPPTDGLLQPAEEVRPGVATTPDHRLHGSWAIGPQGQTMAAGHRVLIQFDLSCRPTYARLRLDIIQSHHPILMTVAVNGWRIGRTALGLRKVHGSRLDYWIPKEAITSSSLSFSFDFDPSPPEAHGIFYAFELTACSLQTGPPATDVAPVEDPGALMALFESLGEDCEFGFVQRYFGIEPIGIFRFGGLQNLCSLVNLLESDLEGMGSPGSLTAEERMACIYRDPEPPLMIPEFFMTDLRLQFSYHTWKGPEASTREEALRENEQKLTYLRRKFLEDLEDAQKIWVFKDTRREDLSEVHAIYDLLNRHGPNKLFWITRVTEARPSGSVEWFGPRLLRGYSDQPHADAQRFIPAVWLELCRNAHRAFAERQ